MAVYRLNHCPSPVDPRDFTIKLSNDNPRGATLAAAAAAPAFVDLSQQCTTIKDQGQVGACTAFATVGAMEYMEKRWNNNTQGDIFSERFTYYVTRVNVANWGTDDSGAYIRDAVKSVVKYGTCKEASFPFNGDFVQRPSAANYTEATKFGALTYATFDTSSKADMLTAVKRTLVAGYPVIAGFTCYSNIWNAVRGVIPEANGQVIGGHAVLLVGYDDRTNRIKFKNSWTSAWGDNGYGYLSYNFFLKGNVSDLWAIYTSKADSKILGVEVNNPAKEKQLLQQKLTELLAQVQARITDATDRTQIEGFFNGLITTYQNEPKVLTTLLTLRTAFRALAT